MVTLSKVLFDYRIWVLTAPGLLIAWSLWRCLRIAMRLETIQKAQKYINRLSEKNTTVPSKLFRLWLWTFLAGIFLGAALVYYLPWVQAI